MATKVARNLGLILVALALSACDVTPSVELSASPRAVEFEPAPPGFCENGGTLIKVGDDHDKNGSLDGVEVIDATVLCDGVDGENGIDGVAGEDGEDGSDGVDGRDGTDGLTPRIVTKNIPPGQICPMGGVVHEVGYDNGAGGEIEGDGLIGSGEIISSREICHGIDGRDGATPLTRLVEVPPGPACPDGGSRFDVGIDNGAGAAIAGDGALAPSEIVESTFICDASAAPGRDALVRSEPSTECEFGGVVFYTGIDEDGDASLTEGEVRDTSEICFEGEESTAIVSPVATLYDSRNTVLGHVLASTGESILVRTPTHYLVEYDWAGTFGSSNVYFSGDDCFSGDFWLAAGAAGREMDARTLVYSPALDSMIAPAGVDGTATSMGGLAASSYYAWNSCVSPPVSANGWAMQSVAWQESGIPQQIVPPLDIR